MAVVSENILLDLDADLAVRLSAIRLGSPHVHVVGRFGEAPPAVGNDRSYERDPRKADAAARMRLLSGLAT
jgi:hypothetical protein